MRRHFEVDFSTGRAFAVRPDEKGDLRREDEHLDDLSARTFTGYGTALAVGQLELAAGSEAEIGFVAFTPKPRTVTLGVRRDREERVGAAGRPILCDRFTLHAKIPFPLSLFAGAQDGHLWFTHAAPPALVRAQQNLISKDDPVVVVDVVPRAPAAARSGTVEARGRRRGPRP